MTGDPLFGPDGTQAPSRRVADRGLPSDPPATDDSAEAAAEPDEVVGADRAGPDDLSDEVPTPPSGSALPRPASSMPPPHRAPEQAARPNARPPFQDEEPSLFGLTRRSRSRLGSRLFTAVFVAIFVLILVQLVTRLFTGV